MGHGQDSAILSNVRRMDPYEFEKLVAKIWEKQGWTAQVTGGSTDRGIDIETIKDDEFETRRHLIQVKRHGANTKVGSEEIQRYAGLYARNEKVDAVFVVTTNEFTREAREVAKNRNVEIVAKNRVVEWIDKFNLGDYPSQNDGPSTRSVESTTGSSSTESASESNDHSISSLIHSLFGSDSREGGSTYDAINGPSYGDSDYEATNEPRYGESDYEATNGPRYGDADYDAINGPRYGDSDDETTDSEGAVDDNHSVWDLLIGTFMVAIVATIPLLLILPYSITPFNIAITTALVTILLFTIFFIFPEADTTDSEDAPPPGTH